MENAINEALKQGNAGIERHFYDAFKSKAQNARLAEVQKEAYKNRPSVAAGQLILSKKERKARINQRYKVLLFIVPLFNYLTVYLFHKGLMTYAFICLWSMLFSACFLIWRSYWMDLC
ncbi:hypothetical protein [Mucilaginibacter pedocola]|uniref:Uncharacterized protein n=1 Tax=Mucilaginibacter pedocola TaxID=1792845 RepID=A0A1S9PIG3_9SPHI|nr:hypothetical protein [Mucilaginibacter pedocola]OOQ60358.1 hypothetical protein BC343_25380 [Mucilaginibacter pedocola]